MNTTYGIQVFQFDRAADVQKIRQAVAEELEHLGLHRSVTIAVTESPPLEGTPHVAVFLGSAQARIHDALTGRLKESVDAATVVIPVVEDLASFRSEIPDSLAFANGFAWSNENDLKRLVRVLLEELGIEERQRRVFISHRREDGLGAAEQLHDQLTHFGFQPFIDRFAIRQGRDVQGEIANALEDHAFLLLLETPLAHTSEWVFDEVDYALSHTMGILIVSWPDVPVPVPGSSRLDRLTLTSQDLTTDEHGYDVLTGAGLDRIVAEVEASHALGLVRRRRMLVKSVEESARAAGVDSCVPLRDWRLLIHRENSSTVIGTTPRLPTAKDLQEIDQASVAAGADQPSLLVHSARALLPDLKTHLQWVAGERSIGVIPENAIGGWW